MPFPNLYVEINLQSLMLIIAVLLLLATPAHLQRSTQKEQPQITTELLIRLT